MVEYSPEKKEIIGYPKRIWRGGTDRGCIEAPHLTKRGEYYYIMCAEGGTGYNHCVTMGRSKNVWGPYEKDPKNPIVTSVPGESYERQDTDHLKPKYYNPDAYYRNPVMEAMWNFPQEKFIWYISAPDLLYRNFAVHLEERRPFRK